MREGLRSGFNGSGVEEKGKPGRKRKRVNGPKDKDHGVVSGGVNNENPNSVDVLAPDEISDLNLEPEVKSKEELNERDPNLTYVDGATNVDCDVNVNSDAKLATVVAPKKRGRKRKNAELSQCNKGDEIDSADLDGRIQVCGRVLRSRTILTADGGNGVLMENVASLGGKVESENDQTEKKKIKVKQVENVNVQRKRGRPKKKGRRGRPPKSNPEKEPFNVTSNRKDKKIMKQSSARMHLNVGSSKVDNVQIQREEASKLRKKSNRLRGKGFVKRVIKKNLQKSDSNKGGGARQEKQLVRDQIVEMIMKAGWTIEYRPRAGRAYEDPVYVDGTGRTHWSVTKAYKMLKEKVDTGVANADEIAAFAVIPDEVLGKLFRVVGKKRSDFGIKKEKGVTIEKVSKNKSLSKKKSHSKCKDKSDPSSRSHGEKPKSFPVQGRNNKRYALLARGSGNESNIAGNGFAIYVRKRSLLSWMIGLGTVPQSEKVQCMTPRKTTVLLDGMIAEEGIRCGCCNDIHTVSGFESHAGSKLGEPFKNIYLQSGPSLLDCLFSTWSKLEKINKIGFCSVDVAGDDPNDDTCNICGDGGDLICCDGCPSTFHQSCLNIQNCPSGDWRCVYCSCKFCGMIGETSQAVDTTVTALFTCQLCEEKFHLGCTEEKDDSESPFCGEGCQKIFKQMQELLGERHKLEEGISWTILQRRDVGSTSSLSDDPENVECNSKLAIAVSIMDECFLPIIDPRSKANMVRNVIYSCGSNFRRLNYSGFYTIILEKDDDIVAAASIRIHGTRLAEMPFVATRYMYRRQGMCRRLLTAIEMALGSVDVEKLVIPAISELTETWMNKFGFVPLEESCKQDMRHVSMVVFPGTDMLEKPLKKHWFTSWKISSAADVDLRKDDEDDEADVAVGSFTEEQYLNRNTSGNSKHIVASEISALDGRPFHAQQAAEQNTSVDGKHIAASEISALDGPPFHAQQATDVMKNFQSGALIGMTEPVDISGNGKGAIDRQLNDEPKL